MTRPADDTPALDPTTIGGVVCAAADRLRAQGIDTAQLDAQLIVAHALGIDRAGVIAHCDRVLGAGELRAIEGLVARRADFEPIAYILGNAPFRKLDLGVDRRVLIPRPETELLVEWALEAIDARVSPVVTVVDACTGSGAVALAIASEAPPGSVDVIATDISDDALDVARANAERLSIDVDFRQGDLLEPVAGETVDIIVANPPYIERREAPSIMPDVVDHEPHVALFVDDGDPLALVRRIACQARELLVPGGLLATEVGAGQADAVASVLTDAGFDRVDVRCDLAGIGRIVGGYR